VAKIFNENGNQKKTIKYELQKKNINGKNNPDTRTHSHHTHRTLNNEFVQQKYPKSNSMLIIDYIIVQQTDDGNDCTLTYMWSCFSLVDFDLFVITMNA
jgi:hypothetical protein